MTTIIKKRHTVALIIYAAALLVLLLGSCKKNGVIEEKDNHASSYNAEVLDKWMTIQLRLMRNAAGVPNHAFARYFSYTGVAAFESIAPGIPGNSLWKSKWNGLTDLPSAAHSKDYFYPANVNAAMAAMNRAFFPAASTADKSAIDSLENVLNNEFLLKENQSRIKLSTEFGKAVATAVFNWAETDGYKNANNPYSSPVGAGLWKPTAPAFAAPATPYWGNNRTVITGSTANTDAVAPVSYSTDPSSDFYKMVKQVYDASASITDDQKNMALFWRDVPGVSSPGHWLSILQQVIRLRNSSLDKAALGYALTGIATNDALISCFKAKYQYNLVRPITYIREVIGNTLWNPYLTTPAHPEYVSAHSSLSAAAAMVLENLFGNTAFTDHTYDYLGWAPRIYSSFTDIGVEAGMSRFYAGIHYIPSINAGFEQGRKVASNILSNKK